MGHTRQGIDEAAQPRLRETHESVRCRLDAVGAVSNNESEIGQMDRHG
jgi:hypothetical protein